MRAGAALARIRKGKEMKKAKWLAAVVAIFAMALCLMGCSASDSKDGSESKAASSPSKDAVKVDDVDWSANMGIWNGKRCMIFSYENKSAYEIEAVGVTFAPKSDSPYDQLCKDFSFLKNGSVDEETLRSDYRVEGIVATRVQAGQVSNERPVLLRSAYVPSQEQFDLWEPEMLAIKYVADGKLYTQYYDYNSQTYSLSSDASDIDQWSDSEFAKAIPFPEGQVISSVSDYSTSFSFETCGSTQDDYKEYLDACKQSGLSAGSITDSSADFSNDKVKVTVFYSELTGKISASVRPNSK